MNKIIVLFISIFLCACGSSATEIRPDVSKVKLTRQAMVVTANPHATKAGIEILKMGGSAVDAAIAIEAVLSLVEPQSSGLGGGGFMTYFDNTAKQMTVYDGRETAPSKATADMFLDGVGKPLTFLNAKHSGVSIGVPGIISMFELAHDDHGELDWGVHFDRAKELAVNGFDVSPRLHGFITRFGKRLPSSTEQGPTDAYDYFHDAQGQPLEVGALLVNKPYARTLESIAKNPSHFYGGDIAQQIISQVSQSPRQGNLSLDDIEKYEAKKRSALCMTYRKRLVCGPQPASSWVSVGEILGLLERAPEFSDKGKDDPINWALFAEAQRLAYADRDRYIADDDFVGVPVDGLLNDDYLSKRASLISKSQAQKEVEPGEPWRYQAQLSDSASAGVDATLDVAGTTHFVVVDKDGNVVSMTASVESVFGSGRMAGGMFLNNQLTDFSFKAVDSEGKLIANRVEPNKRPRSSMSPTIILDESGDFLMATGSPGGSSIIAYNAKTIIGVLDWGLSPQQAIDLPNVVARKGRVRVEKSRASDELIDGLRDYGYDVKESAGENSGFSLIMRHPDGRLEGGVDPRREGTIETLSF